MKTYKPLFTEFFNAAPARLHFAAHSHHPWPDVSFEGQKQYWMDSARLADRKWGKVFGEIIPAVQQHIAKRLTLPAQDGIAFAPNTHEFVNRLLSCLPENPRILTTDSEFHSFNRQIRRLEEDGLVNVTRVEAEPFETFSARFIAAMDKTYDMVFFSQVFFNSGVVVKNFTTIINAIPNKNTLAVIDGYHGFMALPTDLSAIANRAFYMAGGYKYAMSGEGCCFLHCPPGYALRPRNTGWFADMGTLESRQAGPVPFATDGYRLWGATFDASGLYRMRAVMDMLDKEGLTPDILHRHSHSLQKHFLNGLKTMPGTLAVPEDIRGNFITFKTPEADEISRRLLDKNIVTDYRGDRLRFGFGIYQDKADVEELILSIS